MTRRKKRKKREKFFDFRSEKDWVSLLAMLFLFGTFFLAYLYKTYVDPSFLEGVEGKMMKE